MLLLLAAINDIIRDINLIIAKSVICREEKLLLQNLDHLSENSSMELSRLFANLLDSNMIWVLNS